MRNLRQLFVAFLLLFVATTAMAQSQSDNIDGNTTTAVRADINGDGVVNEADIEEIIAIMQQENGVKYYWYVGQTNPASMTSISPVVSDNTSPGWRLIGTTIPTYSVSNMLWNESKGAIVTGESLAKQYVAIPAKSSACPRDGAGNDASTVAIYNKLNNVTIGGVEYKVYETVGKSKKYLLDTY